MEWNAKLDWAEEVYTMLIVLPLPVIVVAVLWSIAPWLHRRSEARAGAQPPQPQENAVPVSGKTADERT